MGLTGLGAPARGNQDAQLDYCALQRADGRGEAEGRDPVGGAGCQG